MLLVRDDTHHLCVVVLSLFKNKVPVWRVLYLFQLWFSATVVMFFLLVLTLSFFLYFHHSNCNPTSVFLGWISYFPFIFLQITLFFFLNILFHLNLSMYFVFFYPRIFFIYPLTLIYKEIIHVLRCFKQIYSCIVWSECLVTHISLPNRRSQCQPSKTENYIIYGWQDFQTTQYFIF